MIPADRRAGQKKEILHSSPAQSDLRENGSPPRCPGVKNNACVVVVTRSSLGAGLHTPIIAVVACDLTCTPHARTPAVRKTKNQNKRSKEDFRGPFIGISGTDGSEE